MAADTSGLSSLASLIQNAALTAESPPISAEALSDKQVSAYIRSLSSLSLSDLKAQPQQLQSKSEALHQQLSELCISQTDAFIDIHHAEQQFGPSLTTFATHLDDLVIHTLPDLQAAADAFLAASKPVLDERERVQNVADQYERGHLSDLLEIPPLVHTCVKAGHHSEAIQLAEHLVNLLKPSDADVAISTNSASSAALGQRNTYLSLLIETLSHLATMKADLIYSFSKPGLKLPAALKSLSVLRRLSHFESLLPTLSDWRLVQASDVLVPQLAMSENQLCLAFLKARIRSFHAALDAMGSPSSSSSSEAYLRRYIDLWRDEMADTLGMAFSLFVDDAPSRSRSDDGQPSTQYMLTPSYLVSSFTTSGLQRLRDTVSVQLVASAHRVRSSSSASPAATLETLAETFANIHTQLSYACASLARFGLDFGALLFAPSAKPVVDPDQSTHSLSTFEAAWLDALTFSLDETFAHTNSQLDKHLQAQHASLPSRWLISSQLPASALEDLYSVDAATSVDSSTYDDYSRPNIELVDYPLIAKLLNRLLEWIHALQVFAPATLSSALLHRLDKHFASLTQRFLTQVPEAISKIDAVSAQADRLLVDDEARSLFQHLDEDDEASRMLQLQLIKDRESAILGKVIAMWHSSVVSWTLSVVRSHIFDMASDDKGVACSRAADAEWIKAQLWISTTQTRVSDSNKQRRHDANARKKAVEEAEAKARAEAEQQARREAEEKARLEAEEHARSKAEHEARIKAEEEARLKAEEEARKAEEARLKAEEEARLKAQESARLKAAEEARLEAEEEARKAEEEARRKAEKEAQAEEEEARIKAEDAARLKAAEEAHIKAEEEKRLKAEARARAVAAEEEAEAKAEAEAAAKAQAEAEAEEKARLQAEHEARLEAEQEARLKAEEEARLNAEVEAAKAKAKAEQEAKEQEMEEAEAAETKAKAKADQEARAKADEEVKAAEAEVAAEAETKAQMDSIDTEAKTDVEPSTTAESSTEHAGDVPEPTAPPAAALQKLNLADKLRRRKEERDRAAAAAAASQTSTEALATTDSNDVPPVADTALASGDPTNTDDSEEVEQNYSNEMTEASQRDETTGSSLAQPGTVKEVVEEKAEKEEAATDGDNDDDDQVEAAAGEDDGSGANTPATPATPNPDGASGGTSGKKNKKNKKKKK